MQSIRQTKGLIGVSVIAMLTFSTGCFTAETPCESLEKSAMRLQVMSQANRASTALSALKALEQGRSDEAIAVLETELKSSLTILYSLSPELQGDLAMVKETVRDAEKYARDHDLKVIKPEDR